MSQDLSRTSRSTSLESTFGQTPEDAKRPLSQKQRMPVLVKVDRGAVRTYTDGGDPTGYGEMQEWVELDGLWYPIPWIKSIQGVRTSELVFDRHIEK